MFEVTREELSRCQFGILNKGRGSNIKYLPFAFTELGVSMLSSVYVMEEENQETFDEIYLALSELANKQKNLVSHPTRPGTG